MSARPADPRLNDRPIPDWFWSEVAVQGGFESLITEFYRTESGHRRLPAPNLHYNVSAALEDVMDGLDARPKLFLFASSECLCAADVLIEAFVEAASRHEKGRYQPVLVLESEETAIAAGRLQTAYGAKLIAVRELREIYQLGEWYFSRFLMRPLLQFPGSIVLDLGSNVFSEMFAQFHRTVLASCETVRMVFLERRFDPLSPALANILRNATAWHAHRGTAVPICLFEEARETFPAEHLWHHVVINGANRRAIDEMTRRRLASTAPPPPLDLTPMLARPSQRGLRRLWPRPVAEVTRPPSLEVVQPDGSPRGATLIRTRGSWVAPGWLAAAQALLSENGELDAVGTQITLELCADGRYGCRWHDLSRPLQVFSAFYEIARRGGRLPIVLLTRRAVVLQSDLDAAALARRLYRLARDGAWQVAAVPESVAIAVDPALHPDRTPARRGRAA